MVEAERPAASGCWSNFFGTGKLLVCSSSGFGIRKSISHRVLVEEFVRPTNSAFALQGGGNWAEHKLTEVSGFRVLRTRTKSRPKVIEMETTPPTLTHSPVGDGMSKHGDGAQSEAAQEEHLALPMESSEGGRVIELPFATSSISCPNSGTFKDVAGEGTAVAQKKRKKRGKNWVKEDTDDLMRAVSNTDKVCIRMEQGTGSDSYWDAIAKAVPDRTGHECRGRMDTLKKSFSTMKKYCDEQGKEFNQLNEKDFGKLKVASRLTEAWYNQIRDHCPPTPKKLKTNGAGSSSKSTGFVPDSSTLGLQPPVFPDGMDQGEPTLAEWRLEFGVGFQRTELVSTPCEGTSPSCDCNLKSYPVMRLTPTRWTLKPKATARSIYIKPCHTR